MKTRRIVLTGGPSSGKTTLINYLQKNEYPCVEEISRTVILETREHGIEHLFLTDPLAFSKKLLTKRIQQYKSTQHSTESIIFFDRGIPDIAAYLNYKNESYDTDFIDGCTAHPYDMIFILPPWKTIHKTDNERYESYEEAKPIYDALLNQYHQLGYNCILVPFDTIENRSNFILNKLNLL